MVFTQWITGAFSSAFNYYFNASNKLAFSQLHLLKGANRVWTIENCRILNGNWVRGLQDLPHTQKFARRTHGPQGLVVFITKTCHRDVVGIHGQVIRGKDTSGVWKNHCAGFPMLSSWHRIRSSPGKCTQRSCPGKAISVSVPKGFFENTFKILE